MDEVALKAEYERHGFFNRLVTAHGWRYVALVICVYGINQGAGEGWTFFAQQYFLTDPRKADYLKNERSLAAEFLFDGSKSLFLAMNTWMTGPAHRMLLENERDSFNSTTNNETSSNDTTAYGLGLSPARYAEIDAFTNIPWQIKALYGVASDVFPILGYNKTPYMMMASVTGVLSFFLLWLSPVAMSSLGAAWLLLLANFSIASPDVMIDGSIAERSSQVPFHAADLQSLCWMSFGVFKIVSLVVAPRVYETNGARALFGLSTFTALAVAIPSILNWMGEESKRTEETWRARFGRFVEGSKSGPFIRLAFIVTGISMTMGFVSMRGGHAFVSAFAVFFVTPLTSYVIYNYESRVDRDLAKFSLYVFLSGAVQPSAPVLFYWMKQDDFNCGLNLPCFSPEFIANLSIVGYVTFVLGTWTYNRVLTGVSYKKIYAFTQLGMFMLNIIDLAWVNRWNVSIGLTDEAFVLGDEVIAPMVSRWNTMPMMILSAVLCPPDMYATFFALNMGLSNFGGTLGEYFGIGLMLIFDVGTHKYDGLPGFIIARSLFRLLPLCLIPLLLPNGSPDSPPPRQWTKDDVAFFHVDPLSEADNFEPSAVGGTIVNNKTYSRQDALVATELVSLTKTAHDGTTLDVT